MSCYALGSHRPGSVCAGVHFCCACLDDVAQILQTAFSKKKIDRYIDVDKLSKRSFQTNMEFLQFMKCYWDMHAPNGDGAHVLADAQPANEATAAAPPRKQPPKYPPAAEEKAKPAPAGARRVTSMNKAPPPAASQQLAAEVCTSSGPQEQHDDLPCAHTHRCVSMR